MQILTLENKIFHLNELPDEIDEDLRFSVLDNSDNSNPDHFFIPLIFLESFTGPAVVLKIGEHELTMPLDWCAIVGDPEGPDMEVLPLTSLNDRDSNGYNEISAWNGSLPIQILWLNTLIDNHHIFEQPIKHLFTGKNSIEMHYSIAMNVLNDENSQGFKELARRVELFKLSKPKIAMFNFLYNLFTRRINRLMLLQKNYQYRNCTSINLYRKDVSDFATLTKMNEYLESIDALLVNR
jgi:hypothetical protein